MKKIILAFAAVLLISTSFSQKRYFTKTGNVSFDAGTGLEPVAGINKSSSSIFDATSGQFEFAVLIKGFEFKSAYMQEHFNENYMESDKFPKSTFKGKITNLDKINFSKDGTYPVTVSGTFEMHGVKKEIQTTGTFKVSGDNVTSNAEFTVVMEDYKIEIPGLVKDKISKTAKISVSCTYTILK